MLKGNGTGRMARAWRVACGGAGVTALMLGASTLAAEVETDPSAEIVDHDPSVFRPDPTYEDKPYDIDAQLEIYGGKSKYVVTRPPIELGRELYQAGPFTESDEFLGKLNPVYHEFYVYGDWRTALAFNDNGDAEVGQVATRLNLDFDYRFTSTERIHWFIGPLDRGGQFTRCEFFGNDAPDGDFFDDQCDLQLDGNLDAAFFEGDAGSIYQGLSGEYTNYDLPFAVGLMPLLYQNGVWIEDAFTGFAFAIPAINSPALDISNMDFSFFAGFDKVTNQGVLDNNGIAADHNVNIYGGAVFVEAMEGFWEAGAAFIDGEEGLDDQSHANLTIAFSKRYRAWLSNSTRVVWTLGQERDNNVQQTADGFIVLVENSFITPLPSTLLPYVNLFAGFDRPQSAARAGGAGGILKNTGINFETDGLTGFPKLDDTGQNTFGGAVGLQYLFDLDRQIVVEGASVQVIEGENEPGRPARGDEYALGMRYQMPIDEAWILRADAMRGWRMEDDNIAGARIEIRRKF